MLPRITLMIIYVVPHLLFGQPKQYVSNLFQDESPLEIKLSIAVKEIKASKSDTVYTSYMMQFKNGNKWDSIPIEVRARGNFRRKECYFPPLRVRIKKNDAKGTVFEGNKSLKLVLPCRQSNGDNLVMREYLCYQLYEPISKYIFNTRLLQIEFTDIDSKKVKSLPVTGFFIEDDDVVAKRHHGKVVEDMKLHPKTLHDSSSVRHDFFQFMIGNTDWSTAFLHNAKVIQLDESKSYIPLAYDFDMAGLVDAPYAVTDASLGIQSVKERLYRGFCRNTDVMQAIRAEYLSKEAVMKDILKQSESSLGAKELASVTKFIDEFFSILKSDQKFKVNILDKCRTK